MFSLIQTQAESKSGVLPWALFSLIQTQAESKSGVLPWAVFFNSNTSWEQKSGVLSWTIPWCRQWWMFRTQMHIIRPTTKDAFIAVWTKYRHILRLFSICSGFSCCCCCCFSSSFIQSLGSHSLVFRRFQILCRCIVVEMKRMPTYPSFLNTFTTPLFMLRLGKHPYTVCSLWVVS